MFKTMIKRFSLVLVVIMTLVSIPVTEAHASTHDPYGFIWKDSVTGLDHVQYYEYSSRSGAYMIKDRVTIKGSLLYDMAGLIVMNDVANFSNDKPSVIFTEKGLYVISKSGEVRFMESSLNNTYSVAAGFSAQYFTKNQDDLGENVVGAETKAITSLSFSGKVSRYTDPSITTGSRVERYAVNGNAEKIGYKAYFKNVVKSSTICNQASVYEELVKKTLSSTCKGAKFVGYTGEYSIYLYDLNGNVYEYKFAEKFAKAHKIISDEIVYYFDHNESGFISAIITAKGKRDVATAIKEPKVVKSSKVTSVKNFQSKSMAYNGDELVGTLSAKKNALYWKDKKLPKSIGATDFGITAKGTPCWTVSGKKLYYWTGSSAKLVKNVTSIKYDKNGVVTKYKTGGKWVKFSK